MDAMGHDASLTQDSSEVIDVRIRSSFWKQTLYPPDFIRILAQVRLKERVMFPRKPPRFTHQLHRAGPRESWAEYVTEPAFRSSIPLRTKAPTRFNRLFSRLE